MVNVQETGNFEQFQQDMYEDLLQQLPGDILCSIQELKMHVPEKETFLMVKSTDFFVLLESDWNYRTTSGEPARLVMMLKEDDYFSFSFVVCAAFVSSDDELVETAEICPQDLSNVQTVLKPYFE